jgi:protein TIF31
MSSSAELEIADAAPASPAELIEEKEEENVATNEDEKLKSYKVDAVNQSAAVIENDDDVNEVDEVVEEEVHIKDLYILPPRQKQSNNDAEQCRQEISPFALALPPLRYDEQVQSIRAALMDIIQYTHYTSYRFEIEIFQCNCNHTVTNFTQQQSSSSSISTYTSNNVTGKDAVISIPVQCQSHTYTGTSNSSQTPIVLDEYGDLHVISQHLLEVQPLSETNATNESNNHEVKLAETRNIVGLRIVLERYDMSSLKEHIQRLRYLLNSGNLPTITTLHEPTLAHDSHNDVVENDENNDENQHQHSTTTEGTSDIRNEENNHHSSEVATTTAHKNNNENDRNEEVASKSNNTLPDLQYIPNNMTVDGTNIQDFFYLVFGEDRQFIHSDYSSNSNASTMSNHPSFNSNHKGTNKNHYKKNKKTKNGHGEKTNYNINDIGSATTEHYASYNGTKSHNNVDNNHETIVESNHITNAKQYMQRYNELEELTRTNIRIQYSGYHPPPHHRKLLGDLAYLIVFIPSSVSEFNSTTTNNSMDTIHDSAVHITCTTFGFYVNRTIEAEYVFDPSPLFPESYFSHTLLDCLLHASSEFCTIWTRALTAAKQRNDMNQIQLFNHHSQFNNPNTNYQSIFRVAIRGDFDGFRSISSAIQISNETFDSTFATPSWLVPNFENYKRQKEQCNASKRNFSHSYNLQRVEMELQKTYGVEIRNGAVRDWNEELQIAREMPTTTPQERFERARLIHKVMMEFGEASLLGVIAIADGHIIPMNPNESIRSQVYLINNIFISRGVDTGPETFKITRGDRAARKASNRDLQCIGIFHRMDHNQRSDALYTLATVLIDFLGTRYVCQSILPGILVGDKSHTLLYGSVESGIPLKWDAKLEQSLEDKLGQSFMIAPRSIYRSPLTQERVDEIEEIRKQNVLYNMNESKREKSDPANVDEMIQTCVAIEAKGILGSDQRRYMLDISRLTPRDANWVSKESGGSGKFEEMYVPINQQQPNHKHLEMIPPSLNDDEWVMCVLRPELVTRFTQIRMKQYIEQSKATNNDTPNTDEDVETTKADTTADEGSDPIETVNESNTNMDTTFFLQTLKLNLNVFLPHVRPMIENDVAEQLKDDEELVREVAKYLWDDVLPKITLAIREGAVNQLPADGKSLTEFLHRNGVNCRYLGRLAILAIEQEEKDLKVEIELKLGKLTSIERKTMPRCWLELLECEMVARAAKHILDDYLTSNGGVAALQPAQTIASFLSALISEGEETAAQTEIRKSKQLSCNEPDDDEYAALTIVEVGGIGDAVPTCIKSRSEVWHDIELEIGRRFRYQLTLFNRGNKSHRAIYIPVLRRVCQRTGVKLLAKKYDVGGKCLCGSGSSIGGRLIPSYPISPLDIVEVVPLMKHAAAYSEGFQACSVGTTIVSLPPLQISLPDARATLERAHIQASGRALGKALELAQEAGALYQRVTENAAHPGVIESIDLMATIFLEAGDPINAALNGEKALALTLQSSGLDSTTAFNAHQLLFQMLFAAHDMERAIKHLRAAIYILELMAGPHHTEQYTAYHKLGTVYSHSEYNGKYLTTALECFHEAIKHDSCDRLMDGFMAKNYSKTLEGLENYIDALEYENKANHTLAMFLGKNHKMTQESDATIQQLSKLASEKGNRILNDNKKSKDPKLDAEAAAIADSIAADLVAEEERQSKKKVDKKKRSKK